MRYWDRARTTGGFGMILGFGFWVYARERLRAKYATGGIIDEALF